MKQVIIDYTNHRGERRKRRVMPDVFFFGRTSYHQVPQWVMTARDIEKGELRSFAMKDIHSWEPVK